MTDRELLELAARAAGLKILRFGESEDYYEPCRGYVAFIEWRWPGDDTDDHTGEEEWNPLDDDGDALRLAVKLGIDLLFTFEDVETVATMHARQEDQEMISPWACESWTLKKQDAYAATRRAIVRAAAEIGRAMEWALTTTSSKTSVNAASAASASTTSARAAVDGRFRSKATRGIS